MRNLCHALIAAGGLVLSSAGGVSLAPAADAAKSQMPGVFEPAEQKTIVPEGAQLEALWTEGEFTEGPVPDAQGGILFSDIGDRIMRFDPANKQVTVFRAPSGKANGLKFNPAGKLVACEGAGAGGNRRISITGADGQPHTLAERFRGKRFNSPNDLAIAASGAVYFSDPRYVGDEPRELDFEGVFVVTPQGEVRVATRDVQKPNGVIVTPDGKTVYVSDNNNTADGHHQLVAFAVQTDGTLADKGVLFDFGPGARGIDGMTLDADGNIYATAGRNEKAGVYVFSPQGAPWAFIPTPGDPTNCVFGIGDEASTLYITSATARAESGGPRPPYGLYRIRLAKPGYHVFPKPRS
ncbi:MAG: SMP-30/gluconolactonase/LRE family protein [Pirellulales bacterium]